MYSQKWGPGNRAILVLTLLVLVGSWVGTASGQNSTNSASVAKPALPDTGEPGKSGESASPDVTPPRVPDVQSGSYIIGVEDVSEHQRVEGA